MKWKAAAVYGGVWLLLAVPSALLLVPDVPALLVVMTFGLGLLLLPLPTFFFYYSAAGTGVALRAAGLPTWLASITSLLAVLAAAVLPGALGALLDAASVTSLTSKDRPEHPASAPRRVRLVLSKGVGDPPDPLRSTPCEAVCQTLLFHGEADVVIVQAGTDPRRTLATAWRREARPACPPAFESANDAVPAVARAAIRGDCLVSAPAADTAAEPWLRLIQVKYNDPRLGWTMPPLHRVTKLREVTAGEASDPWDAPSFRHTEIESEVSASPSGLLPKGAAELHLSLVWWRHQRTHGETSWEDAARRAFGYQVRPLDDPGPATLDDVRALLDTPGAAVFDDAQQQMVDGVLRARPRRSPITPAEAALFDRLLRDGRVHDLYLVGAALDEQPDVAAQLLPAMVARLNLPVPREGGHTHSKLAFLLRKLPLDDLRPHGPALLAAVQADGGWGTAPLLALLPQLVDIPDSVWAGALTPGSRQLEAALLGLCNAPAAAAAPQLDRVAAVGRTARDTAPQVYAYQTLRLHGRSVEADAIRARHADRDLQRFDRQVADRTRPGGCKL